MSPLEPDQLDLLNSLVSKYFSADPFDRIEMILIRSYAMLATKVSISHLVFTRGLYLGLVRVLDKLG